MSTPPHCPSCWNALPPQATSCPHCGRPLSQQDIQRAQDVAAKVGIEGRRQGGCCAIVLVLVLIVVLFSLLRGFFLA